MKQYLLENGGFLFVRNGLVKIAQAACAENHRWNQEPGTPQRPDEAWRCITAVLKHGIFNHRPANPLPRLQVRLVSTEEEPFQILNNQSCPIFAGAPAAAELLF